MVNPGNYNYSQTKYATFPQHQIQTCYNLITWVGVEVPYPARAMPDPVKPVNQGASVCKKRSSLGLIQYY